MNETRRQYPRRDAYKYQILMARAQISKSSRDMTSFCNPSQKAETKNVLMELIL